MKRAAAIVSVVAIAALARADMTQLPAMVMDALSSIDRAPSAVDLDSALQTTDSAAATQLASIAIDPNVDIGVALRSIFALTQYPQSVIGSTLAHDTLVSLLQSTQSSTRPVDILRLRAAIEALGLLRVASDVDVIVPINGDPSMLDHASRDVRAAAAHALRDLGNPAAVPALRTRLGQEMVAQVRLAIADALGALGGA
jgi:HEAT repeat protein